MKATPFGLALFAASSLAMPPAHAAATTVIYSFAGGADGEYADTDLVRDAHGRLYGTTVRGGEHASGTVWELIPKKNGNWTHKVLYSFTGGADGAEPYKGVTLDSAGNLYGTAVTGGGGGCEGGCGVAYKLTHTGKTWTQEVIHTFSGGEDGSGPGAGLTVDSAGNIYGMAPTGGAYGAGTIYRTYKDRNGNWQFALVHTFTGGADGAGGSAGRLVLRGLNLYGAATAGGANGQGTVYALLPTKSGEWQFKLLYTFLDEPDAGFPYGGLTFDAAGNLYGTTYYAGAYDLGAVYELMPRKKGPWREKLLYSFQGGGDGASSISNINFDSAGNIYGTTSEGGAAGEGVIFALTPSGKRWSESVVHSFSGPPDGAFAYNGMVGDGANHFFGATVHGGEDDEGAIYQFTP